MKNHSRNMDYPDTVLSRREFLITALLASGAVVMGSHGFLEAAAPRTSDMGWQADWPTRERPLIEDMHNRTVKMYTELSLIHLARATPHWGIGYAGGTLADKFILLSTARPEEFHDALVRIGAQPGNNLDMESYGEFVSGDAIAVSALWPGLKGALNLKDIFHDEAGKGFSIRFGGNRQAALTHRTGCLTCFESCPVGITSNTVYPHIRGIQRSIMPNSRFRGRPEALPRREAFAMVINYRPAAKG
jgi:hypothetical protein